MEGLRQWMTLVEYRATFCCCLMIPLDADGGICPVCKTSPLHAFGDHASHSRHYPGFQYKHDHVCEILFNVVLRVGIPLKKEAHVNFF